MDATRERRCDVLVAGGGLGGVAAALAATARGLDVVMSEPTDWIGGQLTSQAVPPDEHRWIERYGCTATYRKLRDGIRAHYRALYPLTAAPRTGSPRRPTCARRGGWSRCARSSSRTSRWLSAGAHGAARFHDSAGIGHHRIDLHPSTGGDPYIDLATCPFQLPLGALVPVRLENLLAAGKAIGTTHITIGAYRLHPVEWNAGEAAGHLAAFCAARRVPPRAVWERPALLAAFQRELDAAGIEREWRLESAAGAGYAGAR